MNTKTVYQIDAHNMLRGAITLDESDQSPLEPGVWLIPAGCVEIPPPAIPEGKRAIYTGEGWDLVNEPVEESAPDPEPKSEPADMLPEDMRRYLTSIAQKHMDKTAQQRNYDGILSMCTYATSTNPKFAAEGQAGVEWRDDVWALCYKLLDHVGDGSADSPTAAELIELLPTFSWPDTQE